MKTSAKFLLFLAILMLAVGCGRKSQHDILDTLGIEPEVRFGHNWETPYPDLTDGQIRQLIITSIANGDKETFANLVEYPILRDYPLRHIENKQQMMEKFDLIFDAPFRDTLRTMDSSSWETVGWRGSMLCNGMLWGDYPVEEINYSSPLEQAYRQKIIGAEIRMLHPSLQGPWEPVDRFLLEDKSYGSARIDRDTVGDKGYRLTIFKKGAKVDDKPVFTLYGTCESQGTIGYTTYSFSNDYGYEATYEPDKYSESDAEQATFRPSIQLETPKGRSIELTIAKKRYYQPCFIAVE